MRDLTDVEYEILGALYFIEPFNNLKDEINRDIHILKDSLRFLIEHKLVSVCIWNDEIGDYDKTYLYDSGNLSQYHFLITREGLLAHNGY